MMSPLLLCKLLLLTLVVALVSCGSESSPEGRLLNKLDAMQREIDSLDRQEDMQKEIDSLKAQNAVILDSLAKINEELRKLQQGTDL